MKWRSFVICPFPYLTSVQYNVFHSTEAQSINTWLLCTLCRTACLSQVGSFPNRHSQTFWNQSRFFTRNLSSWIPCLENQWSQSLPEANRSCFSFCSCWNGSWRIWNKAELYKGSERGMHFNEQERLHEWTG